MNKLIILLKQLNIIDQVSILMHANLKKVVVHQNNEYSFYIESKDFIPFEEYQLLINSGDQFPYPIEFIFNLWHINWFNELIKTKADWKSWPLFFHRICA